MQLTTASRAEQNSNCPNTLRGEKCKCTLLDSLLLVIVFLEYTAQRIVSLTTVDRSAVAVQEEKEERNDYRSL